MEIIDFSLDIYIYTKIFKRFEIFKLYSFNYLISSIVFLFSFFFVLSPSCINSFFRTIYSQGFPTGLKNPINANMVFLRDVSYPRINQRRTGRFPIKLAHRLNHLRNLTIPKPFLRNRGVELPGPGDRIVIQLPRRRCILQVTLPFPSTE